METEISQLCKLFSLRKDIWNSRYIRLCYFMAQEFSNKMRGNVKYVITV